MNIDKRLLPVLRKSDYPIVHVDMSRWFGTTDFTNLDVMLDQPKARIGSTPSSVLCQTENTTIK